MSQLFENYHRVKKNISLACQKAQRDENHVKLIAVSKFHPIESIVEVASYGQKDFGENYIQEALEKITVRPDLTWHAIGPIQSKKTKDIVGKFSLIHTLATPSFLQELIKRVPQDSVQELLLQVNIGREEQKSGLLPEDCLDFMRQILPLQHLKVVGLMCLPPFNDDAEVTRPYFRQMRELRDSLVKELDTHLPHLSMGMSGDFQVAIEEGATIIRVGTDIFGQRKVG